MNDPQYWARRLDEFLEHRKSVGRKPSVIADDKVIVGQWIDFALEEQTDPADRNTRLLEHWTTQVKDLVPHAQSSYRAHVRQWWNWIEATNGDASERLERLVTEFRSSGNDSAIAAADNVATEPGSVGGYALADQGAHLRARERFEEILRRLPSMPHAERQELKEIWRPKGEGSYGGVGQIVQLASFIDQASESEWETLRRQLVALCFGQGDLAERLQSAYDGIYGLGWASATRVVAVLDPQRVIPNYSLHNPGRWAGKLDSLQLLMDEGLLESEIRQRAETVLQAHPRSKPSGRAVVESNDLLLEILRPHFTDGDSVDTWGIRTFLYWLSERFMDLQEADGLARGGDNIELNLSTLVSQFRASGYPSDDDHQHELARVGFEQILRSLPETAHEDREAVKAVWNPAEFDYGSVGYAGAGANKLVNKASARDWMQIRDELAEVCFGSDDEVTRLDRAAASGVLSGVRYVVGTRLLAICQPHDVIPIYLLRKSRKYPGVIDMIEVLDRLDLIGEVDRQGVQELRSLSDAGLNSGAVVMKANDLLLETLRPHFSDDGDVDTWGMSKFLYWLMDQHGEDDGGSDVEDEGGDQESGSADERLAIALREAQKDLHCGVDFLNKVVGLLEDKGQVILYGPPGTGKTHFAQRLSLALVSASQPEAPAGEGEYAAESDAFSLVQFHPAYSYEDFFEGYRPQVDGEGQMTYQLTPGPLLTIATKARANPSQRHVMVIDEINRANLPRVLGELLFLLEYRDKGIHTQYRPGQEFKLPENLWFIGTMNTADRSIALIDAAMRRRFHFVPFFPNRAPVQGLLHRWTQQNARDQEHVAHLLDEVNKELEESLSGDHLLIGPSHFMKTGLTDEAVERIWRYNIEPLIEDQFFGQQDAINRFRFDQVWERHGPQAAARESESETPDVAVEDTEHVATPDEDSAGHGGE